MTWQPPHSPPNRPRPHGAWFVLPALLLIAAPTCLAAAAIVRTGARTVDHLRDVTVYGDGNPAPAREPTTPGSAETLSTLAPICLALAIVALVALTIARRSSRRTSAR